MEKKSFKVFYNFDFIISDCVPEAFDLSKDFNIPSLGSRILHGIGILKKFVN